MSDAHQATESTRAILARRGVLHTRALPPLDQIHRSVGSILATWPDVVRKPSAEDREKLALNMLFRVQNWKWDDVTTQRVISAAVAVFDEDRRERADLRPVRDFYLAEISTCDRGAFLDGMVGVYVDSFALGAAHTRTLAQALAVRNADIGGRNQKLTESLPSLFRPDEAPKELAKVMLGAEHPYETLKTMGFSSPHTSGLAKAAHHTFVERLAPDLAEADARSKLFNWLAPESGPVLQTGAGPAIEAVLAVWRDRTPSDALRNELSELIIAGWNDPRLHTGGIWSGFDPDLKSVLLRWMTREDMEFFCNIVSLSQKNHMWPPRRDFWLSMHDEGRIDEAWVAFSADAYETATRQLRRQGGAATRFGKQVGIQDLSLLVMRIGNKIVVDGCHSYKTHVFKIDDPKAPKLYRLRYDAIDIRNASKLSKKHHWSESRKLATWEIWVDQNV
ncbi:EH signature domain-containing protein [Roseibium sp.]|uniref:EH signature domain-containing protein n=1 Tax=Roseibium sp. TaxID=1936156 RepID=UPI003A969E33